MCEIQTSNSGQNNTKFLNRFDINAEQAKAMTDLLRESVEAKHNVGFAKLEVKHSRRLRLFGSTEKYICVSSTQADKQMFQGQRI